MTRSETSADFDASTCKTCGSPMSLVANHPYPVITQILFGLSFLVFFFAFDSIKAWPLAAWTWTALQIALGLILIQKRIRARRRVYRCVRCSRPLP